MTVEAAEEYFTEFSQSRLIQKSLESTKIQTIQLLGDQDWDLGVELEVCQI